MKAMKKKTLTMATKKNLKGNNNQGQGRKSFRPCIQNMEGAAPKTYQRKKGGDYDHKCKKSGEEI
jgi:hypothetical protein